MLAESGFPHDTDPVPIGQLAARPAGDAKGAGHTSHHARPETASDTRRWAQPGSRDGTVRFQDPVQRRAKLIMKTFGGELELGSSLQLVSYRSLE